MDLPNTVLLSQSMALRRQLDITANNLANADTPGFRRESPVFREFIQRAPGVASSR
ncbi:MAG: flagellar biosynthesis protein FlgF, partial [Alphaproteobacteria bacterium]|nr:flagellar biosynthesis protein FlgF [Alphaproteobacteria bacterium]